jgi:Competence protein CoiA-like family
MESQIIKSPFGLREGELVHISEVESGLSCDCVCPSPSCGSKLIARKGKVRSPHFAHWKSDECAHGFETALHMKGKEILKKYKYINLPPVNVEFPNSPKKDWIINDKYKVIPERIILEKKLGEIVPDIVIYYKNVPLIIEIVVTHDVSSEKLSKIHEMGISALKIDLSKNNRSFKDDDLVETIVDKIDNKTWLYNIKASKTLKDVHTHVEKKYYQDSPYVSGFGVNDCPRGLRPEYRNTVSVKDDCDSCEFNFASHEKSGPGFGLWGIVECLGKSKISTFEDFEKYQKLYEDFEKYHRDRR